VTHRHHRWLAAGFVLGGLIAIFGLFAGLDATAVSGGVCREAFRASGRHRRGKRKVGSDRRQRPGRAGRRDAALLSEAESTLERFANKWVSSRRVTRSWTTMHMNLDTLRRGPSPARRLDHRLHFGSGGDLRGRHAGALLLKSKTVAILESRLGRQLADLVEKRGGRPFSPRRLPKFRYRPRRDC